MMGKFDIYKEEVKLDTTAGKGVEYVLRPVGGDKIDSIFLLSKNAKEDDFLGSLDKDSIRAMRELVEDTLVASYPDEDEGAMRLFAQQNFSVFLEPVLNVNMGKFNREA